MPAHARADVPVLYPRSPAQSRPARGSGPRSCSSRAEGRTTTPAGLDIRTGSSTRRSFAREGVKAVSISLVVLLARGRCWSETGPEFGPAVRAAGVEGAVRPYDLRHSFVSILLAEGATVVEVVRQAGHSPTMTLSTYAHMLGARARSNVRRRTRSDA